MSVSARVVTVVNKVRKRENVTFMTTWYLDVIEVDRYVITL
jgi:hypothetical protein